MKNSAKKNLVKIKIVEFTRAPIDDWKKNSHLANVSCKNCGNSHEIRVAYPETKNVDKITKIPYPLQRVVYN